MVTAAALLIGVMLSAAAPPGRLVKEVTPACQSREWMQRLWAQLGAENEAGFMAIVHDGISKKQCIKWEKGKRVAVEAESKDPPLLCVKPFGSKMPCYWTFEFDLLRDSDH